MSKRAHIDQEDKERNAFREYLVMNGIYMKITELFINLFEERAETRQEVAEKVHKFLKENYPPA